MVYYVPPTYTKFARANNDQPINLGVSIVKQPGAQNEVADIG